MITRLPSLLAMLLLLLSPGCTQENPDKQEIQQVFADVTLFNDTRNGAAVVECFTDETFRGYEKLIQLGLKGRPDELKQLGPNDRMEVFRMRLLAKPSQVEGLTGREYCEWATSQGWYVTPPLDRTEDTLRNVRIHGEQAWGELVSDGQRTGVRLHFVKEKGKWRFDEPDAFRHWDRLWLEQAGAEGVPIDELIFEELEHQLGREVTEAVWKPMKR